MHLGKNRVAEFCFRGLATAATGQLWLIVLIALFATGSMLAQEAPVGDEAADDAAEPDAPQVDGEPQVNQDRVAELTEKILAKPFEIKNYRLRSHEYARGNAWKQAAADQRKILEISPVKSQRWQQAAAMIVLAEDVEGYQQFCEKMTERFGASDDQGDLERLAKVCTLAPSPVGELDKLKQLAEAAIEAVENTGQTYWTPYHHRTLALVHLRRKEYAQAIERIGKSDRLNLEFDERRFGDIEVSNRAIEAMCIVRRGKLEEAKKILAKATPILKGRMADLDALYADEFWHDWLIAKVLHDEAKQLIAGGGMGDAKWAKAKKADR